MTRNDLDRRRFMHVAAATASVTLLAGCAGDESGGGGDPEPEADGDAGDDGGDAGTSGDEPDYDGWFDDVDYYEGTVDRTGEDEVTVTNGAGDTGLEYDPAAIRVDAGTTVVWEWTGEGGGHTVTHEGGEFESENSGEAGFTFEHTFEEAGVYKYYCEPHRAVGQKGAVVVE